jgi:hypothetical protein
MSNKKILNINQQHEVNDYPYGSLKCTAFFSVEFMPKKGFRSVFQTINPRNGRLNNPKKSTYSDFVYNYIEEETGHIKAGHMSIRSFEDVNKVAAFIASNFEALRLHTEMTKNICAVMFTSVRITSNYLPKNAIAAFELVKPHAETLLEGFKNGTNIFDQIKIDTAGIEEIKKQASKTITEPA